MVKEFNDVVFTTGKVGKVRTLACKAFSVGASAWGYLGGCNGARKEVGMHIHA